MLIKARLFQSLYSPLMSWEYKDIITEDNLCIQNSLYPLYIFKISKLVGFIRILYLMTRTNIKLPNVWWKYWKIFHERLEWFPSKNIAEEKYFPTVTSLEFLRNEYLLAEWRTLYFFDTLFSDCSWIFKIVYFITYYADLTLFYTCTCDLLKNHINELHKLKCKQETTLSRILFFKNFRATYDYLCHILAINKFIENTYLCRVARRVGRNLQKLAGVLHFLLRCSHT